MNKTITTPRLFIVAAKQLSHRRVDSTSISIYTFMLRTKRQTGKHFNIFPIGEV